MSSLIVWLAVFLVVCHGDELPPENGSAVLCSSKGLLKLEKPFPAPGTHKQRLPFCSKFQCGCCGQRSVRIIARAVTEGWNDDSLPDACRGVLEQMYCSVCDPLVGTDSQPVCQSTCERWWSACKEAFFSLDSGGDLLPCGPPGSSHLICSQLQQLAPGPVELCSMAGYTMGDTTDTSSCFTGTPTSPPPSTLCSTPFHDPQPLPGTGDADGPTPRSSVGLILDSASDLRLVLRGMMLIAFITFVVKRYALRNRQHAVVMQRLELHQQRMRLQNQHRAAAAAAAEARQAAAELREKIE